MSKNIFILNSANDINPYREQANFDPVSISNLESLTNDYYNLICVACMEQVSEEDAKKILQTIVSKLRPGGEVLIVMNDIRKQCQLFVDNTIEESQIVSVFINRKNTISSDQIIENLLASSFEIINIAKSAGKQTIHMGKKHEN